MQRFPQIDEHSSTHFRSSRSTDFISKDVATPIPQSVQQTTKPDIPINIIRSRSCSGGRKAPITPRALIRNGIFYNQNKSFSL